MKDFTLTIYKQLLQSLISKEHKFQTVEEYFTLASSPSRPLILMRHDVDRRPENALRMAKLENKLGVKATYYFRTIPQTFKPEIIKEIADLGHEIGYHYENMDICNGNVDLAYEDFKLNLEKLRGLCPVRTICMHGSPLSKWDNRDIWNKYDYRELEIEFEPYFDVNYNEFYYITDTGRKWDGERTSVRDKVNSEGSKWPGYHSTKDILLALQRDKFSTKVLMTIHPQRWTNNPISWTKELVSQNIKNMIKYFLIKYKNK